MHFLGKINSDQNYIFNNYNVTFAALLMILINNSDFLQILINNSSSYLLERFLQLYLLNFI